MFYTDYVACTNVFPLTKENLPVGDSWVWNQSNAKVSVALDSQRVVSIQKMNPRKKRGAASTPSYKLWIYIISQRGEKDLFFIWCEKGLPRYLSLPPIPEKPECYSYGVATSIGIVYPGDLTIEDFAFLSAFTDIDTASNLGWL